MARGTVGRGKVGHADSPRQDTQRPTHADHGDAGGQESTTSRFPRTQRPADVPPPPGTPPAPGRRHEEQPLPEGGRQAQRPGQHARAEDRLGARDVETFRSAEPEGFTGTAGGSRRADAIYGETAATRRTSRSSTSSRRDRAVGAEEPPPRPRRRS